MLSINSTFHEIEHAHQRDNKSTKAISKEMGVGENKLRRNLIAAGFEYDTSSKKWRYILLDESKDKRDMSFWAFDEELKNGISSNISNKSITYVSNKDITHIPNGSNIGNIGNTNDKEFTHIEIETLKLIAQSYIENKQINMGNTSNNIIDRISQLETGTPQKKTFSIDANIIKQLDEFCETNRIKKSDALAIAIEELLARYK